MKQINYIALCGSDVCAFKRTVRAKKHKNGKKYDCYEPSYIGAQTKIVSRDAVDCPDCKSVLFWTTNEILLKDRQKIG